MGVPPAVDGRATTQPLLRTTLLFLVLWVPSTALDVLTTEIARRQGGWVELNPTGFIPPSAAVVRELILTLAATAAVLVGAWFRRDALCTAADTTRNHFCEVLFQKTAWAVPLIGIPLVAAIGRYGVGISNACYLTMGWSPIDAVLWRPLEALFRNDALAHVVAMVISMSVLWYPITALSFRLLHAVHGGERRAEPGAGATRGR